MSNDLIGSVYKITCNCGCELIYIGSTTGSIRKRLAQHIYKAKSNPGSSKLIKHMNDVGTCQFSISLVEACYGKDKRQLRKAEEKWIRFYNSIDKGFNQFSADVNYTLRMIPKNPENYSLNTTDRNNVLKYNEQRNAIMNSEKEIRLKLEQEIDRLKTLNTQYESIINLYQNTIKDWENKYNILIEENKKYRSEDIPKKLL